MKQTILLLTIFMVFTACGDNILSVLDEPESYDVNVTKEELVGTWVLAERTKKEYLEEIEFWFTKVKTIQKSEYMKDKKSIEKGYIQFFSDKTFKFDCFVMNDTVSIYSLGTWKINPKGRSIILNFNNKSLIFSLEELYFKKIDNKVYLFESNEYADIYKETYYIKKVAKGVVK